MNLAAAPPPVAPPPPAASRRWAEAAWPVLAGLLAAVALVLYAAPSGEWDWQPALAWREPWRWWTAAGVHWSAAHLAMNLAGCGVLALLGWRGGLGLRAAAAWALAWPLTQLALLAQPALLHYGGLSGVLHAGVAVVACHLWRHERGSRRWIGALLAAGLVAKVLSESPWGAATRLLPGWDFALAPLAHAAGALAGALCALGLDGRRLRGGRAAG